MLRGDDAFPAARTRAHLRGVDAIFHAHDHASPSVRYHNAHSEVHSRARVYGSRSVYFTVFILQVEDPLESDREAASSDPAEAERRLDLEQQRMLNEVTSLFTRAFGDLNHTAVCTIAQWAMDSSSMKWLSCLAFICSAGSAG